MAMTMTQKLLARKAGLDFGLYVHIVSFLASRKSN